MGLDEAKERRARALARRASRHAYDSADDQDATDDSADDEQDAAYDRGALARTRLREMEYDDDVEQAYPRGPSGIGNMIWGGLMILGGLSGQFALRGTGSSGLLVLVGVGFLGYGIYQASTR